MDEALTLVEPKPSKLANALALWKASKVKWSVFYLVPVGVAVHGIDIARRWAFYQQPAWLAESRLKRVQSRIRLHKREADRIQGAFQGPPGGKEEMAQAMALWESLQKKLAHLYTLESMLRGCLPWKTADKYAPWVAGVR